VDTRLSALVEGIYFQRVSVVQEHGAELQKGSLVWAKGIKTFSIVQQCTFEYLHTYNDIVPL
jgi:hypothetical protein